MKISRLAVTLVAAVASCGAGGRQQNALVALRAGYAAFPGTIDGACALAASRCTRCHTIDRVLLARVESRAHWHYYVERMRRQPQSGISLDEGETISRCLIYRSFDAERTP